MIKFLISCIIIIFVFSCKEIQNNKITSKINNSVEKIEKIIEKKNTNKTDLTNKINKKNEEVFYFLEEPYFIEGVEYLPKENYEYSEIGISTFYGKELHNTKTVNNDVNKVTELLGRHKTLPIPSMVTITNLDNGLSINIKIIDRHRDNASLIQVSRKVAQLLGFYKDKIATVRVDILSDASKQWKNVMISLNEPNFNETISSAPTEVVSISEIDSNNLPDDNDYNYDPIELKSEEVDSFELFLKVFNFKDNSDIVNIMNSLSDDLNYTSKRNDLFYNLIIGPVDKGEINNLVSYFISKGYKETKLVLK